MSYESPAKRDLYALVEELKKSYQGKNAKRHSFITLYEQLVSQTSRSTDLPENIQHVLIGALIFELGDIKFGEYNGKSPKKSEGWFYSTGSNLYTIIKSKLNINDKNKFGYDERLFYLNEFYKYVDKVYTDGNLNELKVKCQYSLTWKTKQELKDNIRAVLVPVLKRNSDSLYYLVHGVPVLNALLKSLQDLESEYCKDSKNPTNPKRVATINCIKFIIQTYMNKDSSDVSWHACVGVVIFALIQVEQEYKFLSPKRSALFRNCLRALNADGLDKISIDDKIKCLRALSSHLTLVCEKPAIYSSFLDKVIASSEAQKLQHEDLDKEIKQFRAKIEQYLTQLYALKKAPSNTAYAASTGISYGVQYVAGPAALAIAKNTILGGLSVGGFIAAGPVGSALFAGAGQLVFTGLGRLVTAGILNAITANLCAWLLEKAGKSIGDTTVAVVSYPFSATPKGFEEMRSQLKPEDDIAFVRMVNTLLELDSISASDKDRIRNVLNIDKGGKLKPLLIHSCQQQIWKEKMQ